MCVRKAHWEVSVTSHIRTTTVRARASYPLTPPLGCVSSASLFLSVSHPFLSACTVTHQRGILGVLNNGCSTIQAETQCNLRERLVCLLDNQTVAVCALLFKTIYNLFIHLSSSPSFTPRPLLEIPSWASICESTVTDSLGAFMSERSELWVEQSWTSPQSRIYEWEV